MLFGINLGIASLLQSICQLKDKSTSEQHIFPRNLVFQKKNKTYCSGKILQTVLPLKYNFGNIISEY